MTKIDLLPVVTTVIFVTMAFAIMCIHLRMLILEKRIDEISNKQKSIELQDKE